MNSLFPDIGYWLSVRDGDPRAFDLYRRHYSYHPYKDGRRAAHSGYRNRFLIMGPGEKMLLLGADERALFGWRKFVSDDGQQGINCAVFRNEGVRRASDLIREAVALAWQRWPATRLYTYVNPKKVASGVPGYCFIRAGWRRCGTTQNGLLIFEHRAMR